MTTNNAFASRSNPNYTGEGVLAETIEGTLTTDHSSSSYGIPVFVVNGEPWTAQDLAAGGWDLYGVGDEAYELRCRLLASMPQESQVEYKPEMTDFGFAF